MKSAQPTSQMFGFFCQLKLSAIALKKVQLRREASSGNKKMLDEQYIRCAYSSQARLEKF